MLTPVGSDPSGNPSDVFSVAGEATPGGPAAKREGAGSGATPSRGSGHSLGPDGLGGSGAINIEHAGDQIGPYTLLSVIAEGGFGVVWLAERLQPYQQRVAIKIVKAGMDSRQVLSRFERERQTLAILEHPGIARVIDGGLTQQGRPYFVMEYVSGSSVTEFCDQHSLGLRSRLGLFAQICRVVHAAHVKGVIHRDLKPANILVEGDADRARPRIIDFGMARVVSQQSELFAQSEQVVLAGTLEYMSPEQAKLETGIDTRSDVYALGVILHELLIGELPLASSMLRSVPLDQARSMLGNATARRPSEKLRAMTPERAARVAQRRVTSVRELGDRLRRELDLIVAMATRPERDRRYQSALALAEDIERYLAGEALIAAPDSAIYRLGKLVRRNRLAFGAAAALLMALIGGLVGTSVALQVAIKAKAEADTAREATSEALQVAIKAKADAESAREATKGALERVKATVYASRISASASDLEAGRAISAISRLERCEPGERDSWEWKMLRTQADSSIATIGDFEESTTLVECSPNGAIMLRAGMQGQAHLIDPISGAMLAVLPELETPVARAAFNGDSTMLAVSGKFGEVSLFRVLDDQGRCVPVRIGVSKAPAAGEDFFRHMYFTAGDAELLAVSSYGRLVRFGIPDLNVIKQVSAKRSSVRLCELAGHGRSLVLVNAAGEVGSFDATTLEPIESDEQLQFSRLSTAVMDPATRRIVYSGDTDKLGIWDPQSGNIPLLRGVQFAYLAVSPDGRYFAAAGQDRVVRFASFDDIIRQRGTQAGGAAARSSFELFMHHCELGGSPAGLQFTPDGKYLLVATREGAVRVFATPAFQPVAWLAGHTGGLTHLAVVPGTPLIVTAGTDRRLKIWTIPVSVDLIRSVKDRRVAMARFVDPTTLLVGYRNGEVERWDAPSKRRLSADAVHSSEVGAVAVTPDHRIVTIDIRGRINLWKGLDALLSSYPDQQDDGSLTGSIRLTPSPSGATIVGVAARNRVVRFHVTEQRIEPEPVVEIQSPFTLSGPPVFVLGESLVALQQEERPSGNLPSQEVRQHVIWLVDPTTGQPVDRILAGKSDVLAMLASPDGGQLAVGERAGAIRVFDVATRKQLLELRGHTDNVRALAWLPKSRRILSGGNDSTVRIWDAVTGDQISLIGGLDEVVSQIVASPDERFVAIVTVGGVRVLDSKPFPERLAAELRGDASLRPAIDSLLSSSGDGWQMSSYRLLGGLTQDPVLRQRLSLVRALHAGGWFGTPAITRHTVQRSAVASDGIARGAATATPAARPSDEPQAQPPIGTSP